MLEKYGSRDKCGEVEELRCSADVGPDEDPPLPAPAALLPFGKNGDVKVWNMFGPELVNEVALALDPLEGVFDQARWGILGLKSSFLEGVVRGGIGVVRER